MSRTKAQVLRLDSAAGEWHVDLDTGAATGRTHMKGNIMHSVTFGTDGGGAVVNTSLLVAASKADSSSAGGTAISVFVRNDTSGEWSVTELLPGSTGGRKVPRDIEVHRELMGSFKNVGGRVVLLFS